MLCSCYVAKGDSREFCVRHTQSGAVPTFFVPAVQTFFMHDTHDVFDVVNFSFEPLAGRTRRRRTPSF